jgi:hypothetical protein
MSSQDTSNDAVYKSIAIIFKELSNISTQIDNKGRFSNQVLKLFIASIEKSVENVQLAYGFLCKPAQQSDEKKASDTNKHLHPTQHRQFPSYSSPSLSSSSPPTLESDAILPPPICENCGQKCTIKQVTDKKKKNYGKQFYSCPNWNNGTACKNTFKLEEVWKKEIQSNPSITGYFKPMMSNQPNKLDYEDMD